jgi:excisionase family DNA binding protein
MVSTYLTTAEVAERLHVSQRQVRNMVSQGQLKTLRDGGLLLISSDSLNRALHRPRGAGRAWSSKTAWAAIAFLSGEAAPWLNPHERYRLRTSLQGRSVEDVMVAARKRATVRTFRATAEAVGKLQEHVLPTGGAAMRAADMGAVFGLAGGDGFMDGYVAVGTADEMAAAFHLEEAEDGNVTLREIDFEEGLRNGVPVAAIALDLAESMATREQSAGKRVLRKLLEDYANRG